jgi:anti-sigma B factor antagonist
VRLADLQLSEHGHAVIARLTGEIDLSNAESIAAAIAAAVSNQAAAVVLDLSEVDYLDSAGIELIYRLRAKLAARGQALRLVIPSTSPANEALRLAGIEHHVGTVETVGDALRGPF